MNKQIYAFFFFTSKNVPEQTCAKSVLSLNSSQVYTNGYVTIFTHFDKEDTLWVIWMITGSGLLNKSFSEQEHLVF